MICEFCNGQTLQKKLENNIGCMADCTYVENVEAEVCLECGERYFHAKTLDATDRLLEAEHEVKDRMDIEVVSL